MSSTVSNVHIVQLGRESQEGGKLSKQRKNRKIKSEASTSNTGIMVAGGRRETIEHAADAAGPSSTSTNQQRGSGKVLSADQMAKYVVEEMEKKIKRCRSHRDREVLRGALHLLQCDGCDDDRFVVL